MPARRRSRDRPEMDITTTGRARAEQIPGKAYQEKKGYLPIEQRIDQSFSIHPKVLSNILQN